MSVERVLLVEFSACLGGVVFAYALYPIVLAALAAVFGRERIAHEAPRSEWPRVSVLIAAHNEADVIGERVRNALALDYPVDRLDIVVASDGSSDDTAAIARLAGGDRVRVLEYTSNRGKAQVLNAAFRELRGDIVVLSDANTFTAATSVRRLVRWFQDQRVGVVCGRLVLTDPASGQNVDSLYWKYETFMKRCESRLGALLGANGAIYAIRRSLFTELRRDTLIDDFVLPLLTRLRTDCELVYDPSAIAYEETPSAIGAEFRRRSRIGAGGFQSIPVLWHLLNPGRGWIAFTFFCHKLLRWACPFLLIGMLTCNVALACVNAAYIPVLLAHFGVYALAMAGMLSHARGIFPRTLRLATLFASMNAALLVGFWWWLSGIRNGAWQRTARYE